MSSNRDLIDALVFVSRWIDHWREDAACGLCPTEVGLSDAQSEIARAIAKADAQAAPKPLSVPVSVGSFGDGNSVIGGSKIVRAA